VIFIKPYLKTNNTRFTFSFCNQILSVSSSNQVVENNYFYFVCYGIPVFKSKSILVNCSGAGKNFHAAPAPPK
jgi:hypothetical protein